MDPLELFEMLLNTICWATDKISESGREEIRYLRRRIRLRFRGE